MLIKTFESIKTYLGCLMIFAAACATCALAHPAPLGEEFQVNTGTTYNQAWPRVASRSNGEFVVVWTDYGGQDGDQEGIFGQRFDSAGRQLGGEFQVNTYTTGRQSRPAVTETTEGFVIAWMGEEAPDIHDIFGQRFDVTGQAIGPNFRINGVTDGNQGSPTLAPAATGGFVVVWNSAELSARRFGPGRLAGPEVEVLESGSVSQQRVAAIGGDEFVVAWTDWAGADGSNSGIFARRLDSIGRPLGDSFQVNTSARGYQYYLGVDGADDGSFIIAWTDEGFATSIPRPFIFGQRFDASGDFAGPEFQINTATSFPMISPDIAIQESGDFLVAWRSSGQDGSDSGVFGQLFDSGGRFAGSEFQLNTYTTDAQTSPSLAVAPDGEFVAIWHSFGQDGSSMGIFGQRLALPSIFMDSFESGDTSAWSNSTP